MGIEISEFDLSLGIINMYEHTLSMPLIGEKPVTQPILGNTFGLLVKEYEYWQSLFTIQSEIQKRFLELQAHKLADALAQGMTEATITFPESLVFPATGNGHKETKSVKLSEAGHKLSIKIRNRFFSRETLLQVTQKNLASLEASTDVAIAAFGGLLRFIVSRSMVYDCLPAGKDVIYSTLPGEDIPSMPQSAEPDNGNNNRSKTPFSWQFYLPQWVAFGENGQLLADTIDKAEACILSMQRYLEVLYGAVALAPHMTVDQVYQQKYYGILGQLVNQCRSLCYFRTNEIISKIQRRSTSNNLNRGLRITLPYFDDRSLLLRKIEFEIIPPGRVMFVPAFVIMAIREQITTAQHDTMLNLSTRKHLLVQLSMIEKAFDTKMN
jgi:hypothetical protein